MYLKFFLRYRRKSAKISSKNNAGKTDEDFELDEDLFKRYVYILSTVGNFDCNEIEIDEAVKYIELHNESIKKQNEALEAQRNKK